MEEDQKDMLDATLGLTFVAIQGLPEGVAKENAMNRYTEMAMWASLAIEPKLEQTEDLLGPG